MELIDFILFFQSVIILVFFLAAIKWIAIPKYSSVTRFPSELYYDKGL